MSSSTESREEALRWIDADIDDSARSELTELLEQAQAGDDSAATELAERMSGQLRFGTAGLRGKLRAGPNGMNRAVVARTSAGVASWLGRHGHAGGIVVIGRDARYGSEAFAETAAEVLTAAGFEVRRLPRALPTPVLAFAVGHLAAVAGIQITASHNPPADNGYKLYDGSGQQIVPPADGEIEAAIQAAPRASALPRSAGATVLGEDIVESYLARIAQLPTGGSRYLRIAATPLHGVGGEVLAGALQAAGFAAPHLVASQAAPDPDFPTVEFPNPEEPGAADELLALASEVDADVAIALDPDADRCALGTRGPDGTWRMWHGDETGALLGEHILSTTDVSDPLVATTIVSSSMLAKVAAARGARYAETLTGFKWLTRSGDGLVYAYEEALGLCVDPGYVRDKDGISAAVLACDLAATLKTQGRAPDDLLDELAAKHGVHRTGQVIIRVTRLEVIAALMSTLRAEPPSSLGDDPVQVDDLLPQTDALRLRGDGLRVVVRPSGTEPKLKAYLEVTAPVTGAFTLAHARARADDRLAALESEVRALLRDSGT